MSVVNWHLVIIGESVRGACELEPEVRERLTATRAINGFRNMLIHQHWILDAALVWGIVEDDLPVLRSEVAALLAAHDAADSRPGE